VRPMAQHVVRRRISASFIGVGGRFGDEILNVRRLVVRERHEPPGMRTMRGFNDD
jgi:hypothetical protein